MIRAMPDGLLAALDAAAASLEEEAQLGHLLVAWRLCRAPELGALIERIGASLDRVHHGLRLSRVEWDAALADPPAAVGSLLSRVPFGGHTRAGVEQMTALSALPPDPRYASMVIGFLQTPPLVSLPALSFWRAALRLLERCRDARHAQQLDGQALSQRFKGSMRRAMGELAQALDPAEAVEVPAEAAQRIANLAARYAEPHDFQLSDDLLEEIYAAPEDLGLRAVYADHLLNLEDPRGEYIQLQLSDLGEARGQRTLALERLHWKRWAEPFSALLKRGDIDFRAGFVEGLRLGAPNSRFQALAGHPAWSTVKRVHVAGVRAERFLQPLVTEPARSRLREWRGYCPYSAFRDLALGAPTRFEVLELGRAELPPINALTEADRSALREAPGLPELRGFQVAFDPRHRLDYERWFLRGPLGRKRLDVLCFRTVFTDLPPLIRYLEGTRLRRLRLRCDDAWMELSRPQDEWSHLGLYFAPRHRHGALVEVVAQLPPQLLTHVRVQTTMRLGQPLKKALRKALERQHRLDRVVWR